MKNLVELQSYHLSNIFDNNGMTVPKGIRSLTNLQKLGSIEVQQGDHTLAELGELTQLKRLGILKLRRENEKELCSCLQKLRHLTSLYMVSISNEEHLKLDPLQSPPMSLQRLYLKCTLTAFPEWVASLPYLFKLVLQSSNLNTDPLEALQDLPNLVMLDLRFAYIGQELRCNSSGYPKIKKLVLHQMENLERVHLAKGAMPMLRGLLISCFELETVPLGIEHLTDMQELQLLDMPQQFVKRIERPLGVDIWKVEHIPTLKHIYRGRGRWETKIL